MKNEIILPLTQATFQALDRLENSRAGGIAHREIYGHDEGVDLELIGREVWTAFRKYVEIPGIDDGDATPIH